MFTGNLENRRTAVSKKKLDTAESELRIIINFGNEQCHTWTHCRHKIKSKCTFAKSHCLSRLFARSWDWLKLSFVFTTFDSRKIRFWQGWFKDWESHHQNPEELFKVRGRKMWNLHVYGLRGPTNLSYNNSWVNARPDKNFIVAC